MRYPYSFNHLISSFTEANMRVFFFTLFLYFDFFFSTNELQSVTWINNDKLSFGHIVFLSDARTHAEFFCNTKHIQNKVKMNRADNKKKDHMKCHHICHWQFLFKLTSVRREISRPIFIQITQMNCFHADWSQTFKFYFELFFFLVCDNWLLL